MSRNRAAARDRRINKCRVVGMTLVASFQAIGRLKSPLRLSFATLIDSPTPRGRQAATARPLGRENARTLGTRRHSAKMGGDVRLARFGDWKGAQMTRIQRVAAARSFGRERAVSFLALMLMLIARRMRRGNTERRERPLAATLYRAHAHRHRCDDAGRQSPLRLSGMVQYPGRRHEFWFRALGRGTESSRRRTVRRRYVARRFRL